MERTADAGAPRPIHLALQGGGAHGALTWGVLDRLLEDGRFEPAAVSGTSAGAMNAVALADGHARNGPAGARAALANFWEAVGEAARVSPFRRTVRDQLSRTPGYQFLEGFARLVPPGLLNPLGLDPLRTILSNASTSRPSPRGASASTSPQPTLAPDVRAPSPATSSTSRPSSPLPACPS